MTKSLVWLLAATLISTSCSAGAAQPASGNNRFHLKDRAAERALNTIQGTVSRLVARGSDGSVFILEPDVPDIGRTLDALLVLAESRELSPTQSSRVIKEMLALRDSKTGLVQFDPTGDRDLFDTWRLAVLSTKMQRPASDDLTAALRDPLLTHTLSRRLDRYTSIPVQSLKDEDASAIQQILDIAAIATPGEPELDGAHRLTSTSPTWCGQLATSLQNRRWNRATSLSQILFRVGRQCTDLPLDSQTRAVLGQDPPKEMAGEIVDFAKVVEATEKATIRRYLRLENRPAEGCLNLLRATTGDETLPNIPEALLEHCARAINISSGQVRLGPEVRLALNRTVDTRGALPTTLQGNARAVAFQWDLLRRLGYPHRMVDATWKSMAVSKAQPGYEAEIFLRDLLLSPSNLGPERVRSILLGDADQDLKLLLTSSYVRKTSRCEAGWAAWMKRQISASPPDTNYGLLGYASAVSALRTCPGADEPVVKEAISTIQDRSRDSGPVADKATINDEWLKVEARCLVGLVTPDNRLRRNLDNALKQDFTDAHLGSRLYYSVLRTAQILDQGCGNAWWS